jgi:hypothetical protein
MRLDRKVTIVNESSIDRQSRLPRIDTLAKALELLTSDFAYVRFIGDRKDLEAKTMKWDKVVEDKTPEMTGWI